MNTLEDAYKLLADEILDFIGDSDWDVAGTKVQVRDSMTSTSYWRKVGDVVIENDRFPSMITAGPAGRAVLFLRDTLLRQTGARIWGLSFTFYPSGKINIEYDYSKPEDYEDSDETVELSEALERLRNMGVNVTVDDPQKKQE